MTVEILSASGTVLRTLHHAGQAFAEVPMGLGAGTEYQVRLTNHYPSRRLAVLSVDGINVVDGSDAGYDGPGYVLEPFASVTVKGFLRSNAECARFTFSDAAASYAAGTGRGTKNVGVVGVAVFDEKVRPVRFVPFVVQPIVNPAPWSTNPPFWWGNSTLSSTIGGQASPEFSVSCSAGDTKGVPMASLSHVQSSTGATMKAHRATKSCAASQPTSAAAQTVHAALLGGATPPAQSLGTAYGRAEAFYTSTTTFDRVTRAPALVLALRYATTETLRAWGVPVDAPAFSAPSAFPASPGFAPAPAGWQR